jgi:CRISPR type III-B/RAMP module RAMP protein Cmr6
LEENYGSRSGSAGEIWGGSALKGLLNHYIQIVFGSDPCGKHPCNPAHPDQDRCDYQGVTWNVDRIEHGPGKIHRALFGAPEAKSDKAMRKDYPDFSEYIGAAQGLVTFHDALYIPGSCKDDSPFAKDILTVHQKRYYSKAGLHCPNDYDDPNPVAFLTVRPKVKFFIAITGPSDWAALAIDLLSEALEKWGIGGKTSAGYGRAKISASRPETGEEKKSTLRNSNIFQVIKKEKNERLVSSIDGLLKRAKTELEDYPQLKQEWAIIAIGRFKGAKLEKKHKDKPWFKTLREWSDMSLC